MKNTLKVTPETFVEMLPNLLSKGLNFDSIELEGWIVVTFKGY